MPIKRNVPRALNGAIVPFGAFLGSTPIVPSIFWDVYDSEQRWKWICCNLAGLIDYSNEQTEQINKNTEDIKALNTKYASDIPQLEKRIEALETALETLVSSMLVYDPTKGKYTASINQSRRMLQILGQPADEVMTVNKLIDSGMTVNDFSNKYICAQVINDSMKRFLNIEIPAQEVNE